MVEQIRRLSFLSGLAAVGAGAQLPGRVQAVASAADGGRPDLKISKVEILQITGRNKRRALYLKLHADDGTTGLYGPIDGEAAMLVDRFFKRGLIRQDPFLVNLIPSLEPIQPYQNLSVVSC